MHVRKAVITAAAPYQRALPLQTLIDGSGEEKPVLQILLGYAHSAGVDDVGIVLHPGDERAFREAVGSGARHIKFIPQPEALGYGHAIYCARDFVGDGAFLHIVGDHVYVSPPDQDCAHAIVELAQTDDCCVSAVQPTRETVLSHYGAVAGPRLAGRPNLYRIDTVIEKPTPTEAEQRLLVTGLRAGYYLCFFGMHVLTAAVFDILHDLIARGRRVSLSDALSELARREQCLAMLTSSRRYDLGVRYGFLTAQLALALHGRDSRDVLSMVLEVLAQRQMQSEGAASGE